MCMSKSTLSSKALRNCSSFKINASHKLPATLFRKHWEGFEQRGQGYKDWILFLAFQNSNSMLVSWLVLLSLRNAFEKVMWGNQFKYVNLITCYYSSIWASTGKKDAFRHVVHVFHLLSSQEDLYCAVLKRLVGTTWYSQKKMGEYMRVYINVLKRFSTSFVHTHTSTQSTFIADVGTTIELHATTFCEMFL